MHYNIILSILSKFKMYLFIRNYIATLRIVNLDPSDALPTSALSDLNVKSELTLTPAQQTQFDAIVSGLKVTVGVISNYINMLRSSDCWEHGSAEAKNIK